MFGVLLFVGCSLSLFVVCCMLLVAWCVLFVGCCLVSVGGCCLLFIVWCSLFGVWCLFVVFCLLFECSVSLLRCVVLVVLLFGVYSVLDYCLLFVV